MIMAAKNVFRIPYGDGTLLAELPERTRIIRQTKTALKPLPDPAKAVRNALSSPVAHDPLSKLVGSKSKVTIAFDDPIAFASPQKQPDFREIAIKVVLEELEKLGVEPQNIRLVCAVGLHRKWTTRELGTVIGEKMAYRLGPSKLYNHDAEDKETLIYLGETKRNQEVEVNRAVIESDQTIYVSNPWSPFNGGWKSAAVGLSSYRSIRHHHRPFPMASGKSTMDPKRSAFFRLLNEMGEVIERELAKTGRRFLIIEGAMNNSIPRETVQVVAGHPPQAHEMTLEILQQQHVVEVKGQSDVVIYGMGNDRDPYSKMSIINPILVRNLGLSYSFGLFQNVPLLKEGGIIILVHPCHRQFDDLRYPSYVEMFEKLIPHTQDPFELWDLYAEEYAHRPEFIHKYRYGFGFHGVHPLILWGQGAYGLRYAGRIFLAGATDPEVARMLGFEPFASVEDAIAEAERLMGEDCSITYPEMPDSYICNVG
jgi:nickel-dependent lactate racemase